MSCTAPVVVRPIDPRIALHNAGTEEQHRFFFADQTGRTLFFAPSFFFFAQQLKREVLPGE